MIRFPVECPVTVELGHGNIGLHAPKPGRGGYEEDLPWAVLATKMVTFHFGPNRTRFKILKARVQLGSIEPVGYQLTDAYGSARAKLICEFHQHGVWSVTEADLELTDTGTTHWSLGPVDHPAWPF